MAVLDNSLGVIRKLDQVVLVNGVRDDSLWMGGLTCGSGCGGTSAEFELEGFRWDSRREHLRDAEVQVYVLNAYDGSLSVRADFCGFLDVDHANGSSSDDTVTMSASTITAYLNKVWVGQGTPSSGMRHKSVVKYEMIDAVTGKVTKWHPREILLELFDKLPSYYRSRVRLGNTSVLRGDVEISSPDITFRNVTMASALEQLMAFYGDVSFLERFEGGVTYLDFYRVNDVTRPGRTVVVCEEGEYPADCGANVAEISHEQTMQDVVTRVILYGAPRRFMVDVKGFVPESEGLLAELGEQVETKRLVRDWNPLYEAAVLANPKSAAPGSQGYNLTVAAAASADATTVTLKDPGIDVWVGAWLQVLKTGELLKVTGFTPKAGETAASVTVERAQRGTDPAGIAAGQVLIWLMPGIQYVFKRYKLPACFEPVVKCKENLKRRKDVKQTPYNVQVWHYPTLIGEPEEGDPNQNLWRGYLQEDPVLISSGVNLDLEKGRFVLAQPALNVVGMKKNEKGVPVMAYAEAVVGITFTYEEGNLFYDTGVAESGDIRLPFRSDGLTFSDTRDDLFCDQLTNFGHALRDELGVEQTFGCTWFDEDADDELHRETEAAVMERDDLAKCRAFALNILREKNRRHRSYGVRISYFTRAYRVGQIVVPVGQRDYSSTTLMVTGVTHGFDDHDQSTSLTLDNVKPPKRQKLSRRRKSEE